VNQKLIISCPVIGAELTKSVYPYLPSTPEELADAAAKAVEAGASIIHLHVRDEEGKPTQRVDVFQDVTERIKKKVDCIMQYSTGGAVGTPLEKRCAPLVLKPEMGTLSMGTVNFGPEIFENSEATIIGIAKHLQEKWRMAELEHDYGHMDTLTAMKKVLFRPTITLILS
jgi:3-keto-5-aminohexanoate cleavage enzyme